MQHGSAKDGWKSDPSEKNEGFVVWRERESKIPPLSCMSPKTTLVVQLAKQRDVESSEHKTREFFFVVVLAH